MTEKAARGEADGLEREGCGEGDGLLASVGRGGRLWVLAMQATRGRAGALAGMRRAEPSAVALGAALIGSQHEKCLYSQQSDSVTNLFAWLVQEIRLNGNPPERRPAFEGPATFLTGEW